MVQNQIAVFPRLTSYHCYLSVGFCILAVCCKAVRSAILATAWLLVITVLGHQKILSLSHFTCFVHLPYLEKLLNTKIRTFSHKQFFIMFIKFSNSVHESNLVAGIDFGIQFMLAHKSSKCLPCAK